MNNQLRNGNFTSSEIVALTTVGKDGKSFGKPALTYIQECNMERRLGRCLTDELNAKPLTWGKLVELKVHRILGIEYRLCSTETIVHPIIPYWSGSPDGQKFDNGKTVTDIKCPLTLKSFCQLVQPLYDGLDGIQVMWAIRNGYILNHVSHEKHKDGEKFYWQLVSNSILTNSKFAELIIYVPYFSELDEIKMLASGVEGSEMSKHYWIAMSNEGELPYLNDEGYYKNINTIRFEVPEEDKEFLTAKVLEAGKMLIKNPSVLLAEHSPSLNATIIEGIQLHKI